MNRVELVGRLTKDVEVQKTQSGISVAIFTVACDKRMSKEARERQGAVTADFLDCVAWRGTADYLANYGRKGDWVSVEGRLEKRSYENRSGNKVYVTEVQADSVQLLSSTKKTNEPAVEKEVNDPWVYDSDDMPF